MNLISPIELKQKLDNQEDIDVIDIRENYENDIVSISAKNVPMALVMENLSTLPKTKPVIFFCKNGGRAGALTDLLETHYGFDNVYNLEGGIMGYIETVDPSLPTY